MRFLSILLLSAALLPNEKVTVAVGGDLKEPFGVDFDRSSAMFIIEMGGNRVRKVEKDGAMSVYAGTGEKSDVVTTVAGNGQKGVPKDGEDAVAQPLVDPRAVAADSKGNVYVLERSGNALRVVDAAGKIRTVAGTGKAGLSGDGGPALQAQ